MNSTINVQPLPHKTRKSAFLFLVFVFLTSLPFLYLYATGYRFDITKPTNLVSTGGIYIAVDRSGAEIYIDDELVRETRNFRKAFYAQSIDAGTHRVHVQIPGHHTWVKELPVTKGLVTEAQAFNLPLVPQVRVLSEWQTATGSMVVMTTLTHASSSNELVATSTLKKAALILNEEYRSRVAQFATTSTSTQEESKAQQIKDLIRRNGTTTPESATETATTTKYSNGVKLFESGEDVFATWYGPFEQMPYYYCSPDFPRYSSTTASTTEMEVEVIDEEVVESGPVMHPVQTIPADVACDPTIRIDRMWQNVHAFDFYPGSTDLVIMVLDDGIYLVEIDDRSWQNAQPLFKGNNLRMHIDNGAIYVFDGTLIYQILSEEE